MSKGHTEGLNTPNTCQQICKHNIIPYVTDIRN